MTEAVTEFTVPEAKKYPRTYHLPFSPGTTSDDRIARDVSPIVAESPIVITEKCDGENTCLNERGVFARSHGAPTRNPWASYLWDLHARLKGNLKTLELFGESLYAVHSIRYSGLENYFLLFAIRDGDHWLSWKEVTEYAHLIDIPTVPVLYEGHLTPTELQPTVETLVSQPSRLSGNPAFVPASPTEGIVIRLADAFPDDDFSRSVFKWVRKGHVATSTHWARNWQRAFLKHELERMGYERATEWLNAPPA